MPTDYSLAELASLAGVSPRTVRYYIAQGLLPAPTQLGPAARYTELHLERLRRIKRLQSAHLPLAEIRRLLQLPAEELTALAVPAPAPGTAIAQPPDSALDYIHGLLRQPRPAPAPAAAPAGAVPLRAPEPEPEPEPGRAQWERISLDPDIELHVRRPLTRQQNKRVERLISIARQLLEED